ncbi:unnamed protein product [Toxocara canis]|uniref:Uncharacterized protein n=1 Tax=Toxocara canis TaxID=6265 RepID=A0A183UEH4_TOXCA|nr:unnamed protein product [Toxocara canis]
MYVQIEVESASKLDRFGRGRMSVVVRVRVRGLRLLCALAWQVSVYTRSVWPLILAMDFVRLVSLGQAAIGLWMGPSDTEL